MPHTKLIIKDEVNVKFEGLDLVTRKHLVNKFKYLLPYARHLPAVKLGRWDGCMNFFTLGGSTYLSLLPEILTILDERGYSVELEDLRQPYPKFEFAPVSIDTFAHKTWPKGHQLEGQPILFRDHQVEVINSALTNLQSLQEVATGAGKCLSYKTLVTLKVNNQTPFAKYVTQPIVNNHLTIEIGVLGEIIEEFLKQPLVNNQEVSIANLGIAVNTPSGYTDILYFVKKNNLPMLEFSFSNGYNIRVAESHIFKFITNNVLAKDLVVGDKVLHKDGLVTIVDIKKCDNEDCFDITIPYPHLYYDTNGMLHHNTVITAALSHRVTPYGRSVVIVPTKNLVTQTEEDYCNLGLDVGVFFGDRKEYDRQHTICTWQSLNWLYKNTKNSEVDIPIDKFLDNVVCVILDECFDGNTPILTPSGYKLIKDLREGDQIINYSEGNDEFKVDYVVKQHCNLAKTVKETMYKLTFSDATSVEVTGNHTFLTNIGWIRADQLSGYHDIKSSKSNKVQLKIREIISKPLNVYNLHIKNDHNYVANNVVVSNCHTAKADAVKGLLAGPFSHLPIRWGLTGTIPKDDCDAQALHVTLGKVINKLSASSLQDKGILAQCHVDIIQLLEYQEFKTYQNELKYLLSDTTRLDYIAKLIQNVGNEGNTLVLVDRISAGEELVSRLGDRAVLITGQVDADVRKEHYNEVASSTDKIIVATYGVAAVGINIVKIHNLFLIEPGKSFVRVIQSIGRGLRKGFDKDKVNIYDISSSCKFSKRHLTTRKKYYTESNYPFSVHKVEYKKH